MKRMRSEKGFTLIELLIVVAIIAILAAIAVPNFLEAQTRSKISRVQADFRTLATAIESYVVDNNTVPIILPPPFASSQNTNYRAFDYWIGPSENYAFSTITTPVSYLTSVPGPDPFNTRGQFAEQLALSGGGNAVLGYHYMAIQAAAKANPDDKAEANLDPGIFAPAPIKLLGTEDSTTNANYILMSAGPNRDPRIINSNGSRVAFFTSLAPGNFATRLLEGDKIPYDPTNGTVSDGNIYRIQ